MQTHSALNLENPSIQRILRSAGSCFGRKGYRGASLNEIAREAEVSKSLLHYHFDSKEHLFLEVQLRLFRGLLNKVRTLADSGHRSIAQFNIALDQVMNFVEEDLEHIVVLLEFHTVAREHPEFGRHLMEFNEEIASLVTRGVYNTLGPMVSQLRMPPERLARLVRTVFHGFIVELALAQEPDTRTQVRETFEDVKSLITRSVFMDV
jgi:AcrR family transcriptional regulator